MIELIASSAGALTASMLAMAAVLRQFIKAERGVNGFREESRDILRETLTEIKALHQTTEQMGRRIEYMAGRIESLSQR